MSDKDHLILTAIGPDQIGLVEKISQFITRHRCNIDDSKMAVFYGEFAVIVLISGSDKDLANVARDYREIEIETGLSIAIKEPSSRKSAQPMLPYRLIASCMDHPGIVYQLSGELSRLGINIESLETETYAAPVSGTPIFRLEASISVPASTNINALRERFAEIQQQENIDIDLSLAHGGNPKMS